MGQEGSGISLSNSRLSVKLSDGANTIPLGTSGNPLVTTGSGGGGGSSDTNIIKFGGTTVSLAQKSMAGSIPVVLASDQSSIPVAATQSGSWTAGRTWSLSSGSDSVTITPSGTQTISGTVTANAGTNLNTSALALDTSVNGILLAQTSTTSGQTGPLIQGAVTTSAPSYTTAKTSPLSLTTTGLLRIDGSGITQPVSGTFWQATQPVSGTITANAGTGTFTVSGTVTSNIGTTNGLALDATVSTMSGKLPATLGAHVTSASMAVNIASDQTVPVSGTFWQATQPVSGTVTANIGTTNGLALDTSVNGLLLAQASTTSGQKGSLILGAVTTAAPSYTTAQSSPISLTTTGLLRVDGSGVTQPVSGTFWQATQPVSGTVTANIGTTNGLALDTSVNGLLLAQASTTASQTGPLIQGAVTTAAPSYTTAKTSPLSLTTAGLLRIDGSGATQPVSGTVTSNQGGAPWTQRIQDGSGATLAPVLSATPVGTEAGLYVRVVSQPAGGSAFSVVDKTAFTAGTSSLVPSAGFFDDTPPTALTTGQIGELRSTSFRASHVNLRNNGGTEIGTSGTPIRIDPTGTTTQPVSGTVTANAGTGTFTVSGTVTANAGTNLNTSALALDATLTGRLPAAAALADATANPTLTAIQSYLMGFNGTTWDRLQVDASKFLKINIAGQSLGTVAVSGTVTANAGTGPFPVAGMVASGGSNANNPIKTGGVFNTTQPTVTTGQIVDAQTTARGAQIVAVGVDGFAVSGTVTANIGTTNGLALDASVAKLTIAQNTALGSNTQAMVGGSVTTAAPTYTTGNIQPLSLNTAGGLRVDGSGVTQPVSGTFWQGTQPVSGTVTANAGTGTFTVSGTVTANAGTNLNTSALALDTSVNGLLLAQASTTSGEKGPLIQGAVTTSPPGYTTAQTSPLSLTTTGLLRTDGSNVTQPVSGTVTANAGTNLNTSALALDATLSTMSAKLPAALVGGRLDENIGSWLGSTAPTVGSKTSANSVPVVIASDQGSIPVTISAGTDRTSTGTITSNQSIVINTQASSACGILITGSWTGTLAFEASVDGVIFNPINAIVPGSGTEILSTASNGNWTTAVAGNQQLRVRGANVASGTATVFLDCSTGVQTVILGDPLPTGANTIGAVNAIQSGTWTVQPGNTANTTAWLVTGTGGTFPVTGTFWQSTQPVSIAAAVDVSDRAARLAGHVSIDTGGTMKGSSTSANSLPVVIASDQGAVPVSGTVTSNQGGAPWSQNVTQFGGNAIATGTGAGGVGIPRVTISSDSSLAANQSVNVSQIAGTNTVVALAGVQKVGIVGNAAAIMDAAQNTAAPANELVVGGVFNTSLPSITSGNASQIQLDSSGRVLVSQPTAAALNATVTGTITANQGAGNWNDNIAQWGGTNTSLGQKVMASSVPVVLASDQTVIPASQSGTWTVQPGNTANTTPWLATINQGGNSATVKAASTQPAATDLALVVTQRPGDAQDVVGSTIALNALNVAATITTAGTGSIGMQLVAGTFIGTLVPEISTDGGTTWVQTFFSDPTTGNISTSLIINGNAAYTRTIVAVGGSSTSRVRVSNYVSGTANCTLRATLVNAVAPLSSGAIGAVAPPIILQTGGVDYNGNLQPMRLDSGGNNIVVDNQAIQILSAIHTEMQRHSVLLRRILGATGNDVPDNDTIDSELAIKVGFIQ